MCIRDRFHNTLNWINEEYGSLKKYASYHQYLGFHYDKNKEGWYYREWAPAAEALYLLGDFNDWKNDTHPLYAKEDGIWEIFLPDENGQQQLQHEQLIKVRIHSHGSVRNRIPVYIKRAVQDEATKIFSGQLWNPNNDFTSVSYTHLTLPTTPYV